MVGETIMVVKQSKLMLTGNEKMINDLKIIKEQMEQVRRFCDIK